MTWLWLCIIVGAIVLELATPTALVSIWFALGGLMALIFTVVGMNFTMQLIAFAIVSIGCIFLIRPMATNYLRGNVVATNADRFLHEKGIVTKAITENNWGEVFVKSTYWSAVEVNGKSIEKDKKVVVVAIEGAKLLVKEVHE